MALICGVEIQSSHFCFVATIMKPVTSSLDRQVAVSINWGVLFMGVLITRALLFGFHLRAPDLVSLRHSRFGYMAPPAPKNKTSI